MLSHIDIAPTNIAMSALQIGDTASALLVLDYVHLYMALHDVFFTKLGCACVLSYYETWQTGGRASPDKGLSLPQVHFSIDRDSNFDKAPNGTKSGTSTESM